MDITNVTEVDISNVSGYNDSSYPRSSVNGSSVTLNNTNNNINIKNIPYKLNKNQEEKLDVDDNIVSDQISKIIRPTNLCKNLLYCTIASSVISYVLFIISLSLPKWQLKYNYFQLKEPIFTSALDFIYMIMIMIFTIISFISLLILLRVNRFYRKSYYIIYLCFGILVLLKLILEVIYLIKTDYHELGSSFWLFTISIILDLLSLISYLLLIRQYEKEIKSFRLNKQLEDFKKFGFDSRLTDSVTLSGSQSQSQISYSLNKSLPEKNIINYPPNQNTQRISIASFASQLHNVDNTNISANNSKSCIKNVQEGQNAINSNNIPTKIQNNGNLEKVLPNINKNITNSQNINNNNSNNNNINLSSNTKLNVNLHSNKNITKESSNKEDDNNDLQSSSRINESIAKYNKSMTDNSVDKNLIAVRPARDSSLIMNNSFSNNNSNFNNLLVPVKSSSENKRVSNGSFIINALQEENTSKSQILETFKPQTQESYLYQSDALIENADRNNSFTVNTMEPVHSNELESLHDIESFEEYPSIHQIHQTNSVPSSSAPSQPNSQPPPQQHNQLPKPPIPQRPKSYQQFNSIPYNESVNSKRSPTTIDDYIPLTNSLNTPSQIARESQRDSLLNQIFGTNNDNHSYASMTALPEKGKRETYQSFDQLPLEDQLPVADDLSLNKISKEEKNEISNESQSQMHHPKSYYIPNLHTNTNHDNNALDSLSYSQSNVNGNSSTHGTTNISKYSIKSLQLNNVPINNFDPTVNERINNITVNKYVNEEKERTKENNFDILASSSIAASDYNGKEKEYYQEPYYVNSSYYEKMPFYNKVEEYKETLEEKNSIVSSLSISSSSSSLPHFTPSLNESYKKNSMEGRTEHSLPTKLDSHHRHEDNLSEPPIDEDYLEEYYKTREYSEPKLQTEQEHHHSNSNSLHQSQNYSFSKQSFTSSPYENLQETSEKEDNHHNISKNYDNFNNINENMLNCEEDEEKDQYYQEDEDSIESYHHHHQRSVSTPSENEDEEQMEDHIPNINYEREEDDYENQKPPVTVVTIPPLSPFELPAIAIPFNQPDPREVGSFSPIVTTQPVLTTKTSSYKMNNHLSIPYNRNFLNDFSYNNSNKSNSSNNSISSNFNEQILNKRNQSSGGLTADDIYSPTYYPRNSQPYPSSHLPSQMNQYNSNNETSYTNQLIQQRQQKNKNNLSRKSIHSMTSSSSLHVNNKSYVDNSGLSNNGNISIHSNLNSNDTNSKTENNNITNYQTLYYYVCKQKYIPQNESEIELNIGDVVEIMQYFNDGWRVGKNKTTNCIGAFPQECLSMVSHSGESPDSNVSHKMEAQIEKLKDHKKMINYLEHKLQDPNLSETDRIMYKQHLDYTYLSLVEDSSI
ncbi:hypothetical protein BCR36DRAFT_348536 [Piromyces finnis]|uniref:SH3 domain-containing protein n=1 Tax=Piromyces finnis TaxID=1754191 RepID=A0A1Y1VET3_9FUNG|nr:hypothetical protein BCR36DRAFT_348536 [Piromyces finnis]|eukprot:ORX54346.1 hypothetical protein BCR36DRAFT_348536 [Piromyces finnis]